MMNVRIYQSAYCITIFIVCLLQTHCTLHCCYKQCCWLLLNCEQSPIYTWNQKPQSKMNHDNNVHYLDTVVNAHKQLLPCNDHSRTGLLKIREPQVLNDIILSILCIFQTFHRHILNFSLPFSTSCATLFLLWWCTPETRVTLYNLPLSWLPTRVPCKKSYTAS